MAMPTIRLGMAFRIWDGANPGGELRSQAR